MKRSGIITARIVTAAAGLGLLIAGIINEEYSDVLQKAVRVCLECIGIG